MGETEGRVVKWVAQPKQALANRCNRSQAQGQVGASPSSPLPTPLALFATSEFAKSLVFILKLKCKPFAFKQKYDAGVATRCYTLPSWGWPKHVLLC